MAAYIKGEHALGICDKCGDRRKHTELKGETHNGSPRGYLVCKDCWDGDHPQNFINRVDSTDAQAIKNARPDTGAPASRSFAGWNPLTGELVSIHIGTVRFA
jgi:hypothetical protein